jgi:AcrR family transcriptional regulator
MSGSGAAQSEIVKEDGRLVRGEATRERVLDAAERLFAEHGFDGVSIRQIAQEACVTLGTVGFHGGSKLDLFKTILARRVATLSAARRTALARLRAENAGPPCLYALMDAYISPYIEIASGGDPQWRAYAKLIARIVDDERWYPHVRDLYDPVAREYLEAIHELDDRIDRGRLATAFVLSVASMLSLVASTLRIVSLSGKTIDTSPDSAGVPAYRDTLVAFCVGGIERAVFKDID